ncbi:MAG: glycosyl hydrolase 115 family protein, partial [Clostridia bacterium]|nr:glycosyl hydrolase 115 family protein [Clostridia bacterium]
VDNPLSIPEDITIMWTNDNFGHIRQGSTEAEMARSGGGGMSYHGSYHGKPTDVICTAGTQLGLIKEEMSKAYDKGANNIWILNVGPLKPFENQMEYFIDLGRNMDKLRSTSVNEYVKDNARRYFGFDDTKAQEYADIQCEYLQLANSRRPEFMQQGKFSLTSYGDEMQKEADKYAALLQRSTALYNSLNDDLKPAFYELQLYAIKTANDIMDNYMGADRSVLYLSQSRGAGVNKYIKQSTDGRAAIDPDTAFYNTMLSGKWNNVINPWQNKEIGSWVIKIASAKASDAVTDLP